MTSYTLTALVMAGGRGNRMHSKIEKPLLTFKGKPLIEHVINALRGSKYITDIIVATSKFTRDTEKMLKKSSVKVVSTPGEGYVEDMVYAIKKLALSKTLVVSADMPMLTAESIDFVARKYLGIGSPAMAVMVPLDFFRKNNLEPSMAINGLVPSGVNVVDGSNLNGKEVVLVTQRLEFALNINTLADLNVAEALSSEP